MYLYMKLQIKGWGQGANKEATRGTPTKATVPPDNQKVWRELHAKRMQGQMGGPALSIPEQTFGSPPTQGGLFETIKVPVLEAAHLDRCTFNMLLFALLQDGVRILDSGHDEESWAGRPRSNRAITFRRCARRKGDVHLFDFAELRIMVPQCSCSPRAEGF